MEAYLPYLFVLNIFLTFIDATIGYHAAPTLARLGAGDEAGAESTIRGIRKLLAAVVALYMFFNCLAFFNTKAVLLLLVTGVIILDIVGQLVVTVKVRNRKEE